MDENIIDGAVNGINLKDFNGVVVEDELNGV